MNGGGHYTCENYCNSFGHTCTNAWEEVEEDCRVKSNENCQTRFDFTSDAICECHKLPGTTKKISKYQKVCGDGGVETCKKTLLVFKH